MKCKEWIVSQNRKKILEQELLKALAMGDMVGVNKLFTWYAFNYEFNVWRNDNTFVTYALLKRGVIRDAVEVIGYAYNFQSREFWDPNLKEWIFEGGDR